MPFGIPPWAVGVGVVATVIFFLQVAAARLLPRNYKRRSMKEMMHGEGPSAAELEELQGRLNELDELKRHVAELEERVDFTERLLAQKRESDRLRP